jgi:hypothetical protein
VEAVKRVPVDQTQYGEGDEPLGTKTKPFWFPFCAYIYKVALYFVYYV